MPDKMMLHYEIEVIQFYTIRYLKSWDGVDLSGEALIILEGTQDDQRNRFTL